MMGVIFFRNASLLHEAIYKINNINGKLFYDNIFLNVVFASESHPAKRGDECGNLILILFIEIIRSTPEIKINLLKM